MGSYMKRKFHNASQANIKSKLNNYRVMSLVKEGFLQK